MTEKLGMRISSRFPLPILLAFIFVFALIVIWLQRLASRTTFIHEVNEENMRSFNYVDTDEVTIVLRYYNDRFYSEYDGDFIVGDFVWLEMLCHVPTRLVQYFDKFDKQY